ncbi:AAA family ATPase [Lacticaseibacillus paracasei]|uniref:AAA family ATPase n=1 Tax=Lacticaseibacillus paracasei TaxID=1597 RepID=UPI0021A4D2E5|nr:AAA family ATPase [Lacticaseibacillus paracasei]
MLTFLHLENYRSFGSVDWDLTYRNNPQHIIALYGENGAGKTNLIEAISHVVASAETLINYDGFMDFARDRPSKKNLTEEQMKQFTEFVMNETDTSLGNIFRGAFRIDAKANTVVYLEFDNSDLNKRSNSRGYYELVFDKNHELIKETLFSVINIRNGKILEVKKVDGHLEVFINNNSFKDERYRLELKNRIELFWGKHTLISIIKYINKTTGFKKSSLSASILQFIDLLAKTSYSLEDRGRVHQHSFLSREMMKGTIPKKDESELENTESVLNKFFPQLYSDIINLSYDKKYRGDSIDYSLKVQKNIWGSVTTIPFVLESEGTRKLLDLMPMFADLLEDRTVIIDEIDKSIHDILFLNILNALKNQKKGQLIFNTHNTLLMTRLPKESVYVIQEDSEGYKTTAALVDIKSIKKNNNVQQMYLRGEFSGIPYTDFVDFTEVFKDAN